MTTKVKIIGLTCSVLFSVAGCPPKGSTDGPVPTAKLPAEVAGTWKAKDSPWRIVLTRDGRVSSAVFPMGEVTIRPNQTIRVEMKDGSFSTYKAGNCTVEYSPETRELFVSIAVEEIHVVFTDNRVDGSSTDKFVGPVSEDGRQWAAEWMTMADYGPRFPMDANDMYAGPLLFEKVEQ